MRNEALALGFIIAVILLSLFLPFPRAIVTVAGIVVLFYLPGHLFLSWKEAKLEVMEKLTASIVISMSLVALPYLAYYFIVDADILFFIAGIAALEAIAFAKFRS